MIPLRPLLGYLISNRALFFKIGNEFFESEVLCKWCANTNAISKETIFSEEIEFSSMLLAV